MGLRRVRRTTLGVVSSYKPALKLRALVGGGGDEPHLLEVLTSIGEPGSIPMWGLQPDRRLGQLVSKIWSISA